MIILGLDLSSKSTGVALLKDEQIIAYTTLTASSTDTIKRIQKITNELKEFVEKFSANYKIDKIIMEEVRPDGGLNLQTYKTLMWVQASVAFMLHDTCAAAIEYIYPSSWRSKLGIKQGRGVKRASLKEEDIQYVKDTYNIETNDDAADAICIALSYFKDDEHKLAW